MVGQIAVVASVGKRNTQRQCVVLFAAPLTTPTLPLPLPLRLIVVVVLVVGDVGGRSHPLRPPSQRLSLRVEHWLHAVVELAVGLLTVDDVESIESILHHV